MTDSRTSKTAPRAPAARRVGAGGRRAAAAAAALSVLLLAAPAAAERPITIEMMVTCVSDASGAIDPRGARIHQRLKQELRYQSLRVLDSVKRSVPIDDVLSIALPGGRQARVRPLAIDERGVLLAVDIEGGVKVDARAHSGHLLVFGAGRDGDCRLAVSIEPRF